MTDSAKAPTLADTYGAQQVPELLEWLLTNADAMMKLYEAAREWERTRDPGPGAEAASLAHYRLRNAIAALPEPPQ